ncbi:response regulator transcription factor [Chitinivorax sp. B]|uniref:response regulator transcription factor n=1 Tax=Chitinivorax sp. B TaxID=2502235 RepID=UPI001484E340|nr:response regulator transcription factor [Chitinivorax sp. B]
MTADPGLLQHWGPLSSTFQTVVYNQWLPLPTQVAQPLVIVDTALPGLPEADDVSIAELTARSKTVFVSSTPSDVEGVRWLSCGAVGYCHAFAVHNTLQHVLDVVADGGLWVGRNMMVTLLRGLQAVPTFSVVPSLAGLSEREREVALMAAKGYANKEIARSLNITERTVKAHLTAAFTKLGVTDRLQLALHINGIQ